VGSAGRARSWVLTDIPTHFGVLRHSLL
jgi:hypothetical protein